MSHDEIKAMLVLARAHGVRRLKVGDFEVELGPEPAPPDSPRPEVPADKPQRMPTHDELLHWSSGYDPQVEAEAPE